MNFLFDGSVIGCVLFCAGISGPVPHRGGDLPDVSTERTTEASGELLPDEHYTSILFFKYPIFGDDMSHPIPGGHLLHDALNNWRGLILNDTISSLFTLFALQNLHITDLIITNVY